MSGTLNINTHFLYTIALAYCFYRLAWFCVKKSVIRQVDELWSQRNRFGL